MSQSLEIQELAIALSTRRHNPTILNPDFLVYSGIVPSHWELARSPVITNSAARISYQNGINIVAEVNSIIFSETINTKNFEEVQVSEVAHKYVEALPNVDYLAVSINPRSFVSFTNKDESHKYLFEKLLAPGAWCEFGKAPVNAALQFGYTLERCQLSIAINEATLSLPENQKVPIILFSGSCNYEVFTDSKDDRLRDIQQIIRNWQTDVKIFKEIVNERFLQQESHEIHVTTVPLIKNSFSF